MKKFLLICVFLEDDGNFNSFNYSLNNGFLVIDAVKIYPYTFLQGLENYFEIQEETEIIWYEAVWSDDELYYYINTNVDEEELNKIIENLRK